MFLHTFPKVSVQKLFAVALSLKIISSGLGLLLNDPWILGMALPITIMVAYMVVGYHAREDDVSSEKFADSCYYIGFIFTMTSIIFSLFDLPNLGAGEGMRNIALRFGAAMVSTVLGMGVRVYLVSFRKDASDAIKEAEEGVLDATRMLVSQFNTIVDELKKFELQVIDASKVTVENVNRQISELGQNYAKSLNGFYVQVTEENKATFNVLLEEVRQATSRLADSVDAYSSGMNGNLESIEHKVTEFSSAVTTRLANTTFPDDFFARELKAPLDQLKFEASNLGDNVRTVSSLVQESSGTLAATLKQITSKTKKTKDAMDAMVQISEHHQTLVNNADLQLNSLVKLAERMEQLDAALKGALEVIGTNSNASAELLAKVSALSTEGSTLRLEIKDAMTALTNKLDANATLATGVIGKLESQAGGLRASASEVIASFAQNSDSSEKLAQQLAAAEIVFQGVVEQLRVISSSSAEVAGSAREAAQNAFTAAQSASQASDSVNKAVAQVTEVAGQVKDLDTALRVQTGGLLEAAQKLRQSQDAQPMVIAEAIVHRMAFRAPSTANGLHGANGHVDPSLVTSPVSSPEQVVSNSNGTDTSADSSPI